MLVAREYECRHKFEAYKLLKSRVDPRKKVHVAILISVAYKCNQHISHEVCGAKVCFMSVFEGL